MLYYSQQVNISRVETRLQKLFKIQCAEETVDSLPIKYFSGDDMVICTSLPKNLLEVVSFRAKVNLHVPFWIFTSMLSSVPPISIWDILNV